MAKEVAISKRIKITEAQRYTILSVLVASLFLGVAISLVSSFIRQISFNIDVIAEEEKSIANYSQIIKKIGICKSPKGSIYSGDELKKCDPDGIEVSEIPGTLRANILNEVASNESLSSVPNTNDSNCVNLETGKNYTYKELIENYDNARGNEELNAASQLIRTCSALRVVPDALPSIKNEEALLASLDKLFRISNWEPESLSPTGEIEKSQLANGLNEISVSLSVRTGSDVTRKVLNNIERSIREFNIKNATIEWSGDSNLEFRAQASAYYQDKSSIVETVKKISAEEKKTKTRSK